MQMAIETIKDFNFSDKKYIIRQLVETIVADKKLVVVGGHIPLTGLDMELYAKYWNSRNSMRYGIPFELKIKLLLPKKARTIIERNRLGQIVHTRV